MKNQQQNQDLTLAVNVGLETLSSDEVRVPTRDIEALAMLKSLLRGILAGELIVATPDRVLPEGAQTPDDNDEEEENE